MDVCCTLYLWLDYRLRLWAHTSASRAISAVAELLVLQPDAVMHRSHLHAHLPVLPRPRCWNINVFTVDVFMFHPVICLMQWFRFSVFVFFCLTGFSKVM